MADFCCQVAPVYVCDLNPARCGPRCSYDDSNHKRYAPGLDKSPAVFVTAAGRFFYATAARLLALKFILSMSVSAMQAIILQAVPVPCAARQAASPA